MYPCRVTGGVKGIQMATSTKLEVTGKEKLYDCPSLYQPRKTVEAYGASGGPGSATVWPRRYCCGAWICAPSSPTKDTT